MSRWLGDAFTFLGNEGASAFLRQLIRHDICYYRERTDSIVFTGREVSASIIRDWIEEASRGLPR